ncbi:MAG: DUF4831 family protein [Marinifilaceae bacterium]
MRQRLILLLCLLACVATTQAQKRKDGSTGAPVALNYALPKVSFDVYVELSCSVQIPGPYARYAQKELGMTPTFTERGQSWKLNGVKIEEVSEVDEKCVYTIASRDSYLPILLSLTPDGLLAGAGAQGVIMPASANKNVFEINLQKENLLNNPSLQTLENYSTMKEVLDTNYTMQEFEGEMRRVWDPIVRYENKNEAEHVRDLTREIMRLRNERVKLLSADTDVAEGKLLTTLLEENEKMEQDYLSMFIGSVKTFKVVKRFRVTPTATSKSVLAFHFSPTEGAVIGKSANASAYVLQVVESVTPAGKENETAESQTAALYYRVPASAKIALVRDGQTLNTFNALLPQLGVLKQFPIDAMVSEGLRIRFHAPYGSIQSIEQGARTVSER